MLKNYELLYIVHPDLEGSTEKITDKVAGFIKKIDGEITNQEDWGKRKLAYPIAKNDFGVYILVDFTAESGLLPKVENNLKLSEEVMRFMVVALPEMKAVKPRRTKPKKDEKPEAVAAEAKAEKPKKTEEKVEEPKAEEKPKKTAAKKAVKTEEKPKEEKKTAAKAKKTEAKTEKKEEADRMKKLDAKLEEILGE